MGCRKRIGSACLVSLLAIAGWTWPALAQTQCVPAPVGLVSWWPGEGNATDIRSANNGTNVGSVSFVAGKVGQAFSFNGTNFIRVARNSNLEPSQVTVDAWVKASSPGVFKSIVTKGASGGTSASYALYTGSSGGLIFYVFDGSTFVLSPDAGSGVWDGAFHHVAGTYDGATVRLYVDGVQVGSGTPTTISIGYGLPTNNDLYIGSYNDGITTFPPGFVNFPGVVDEVEIFSRALTGTEIQAIFNAGSAGKCTSITTPPVVSSLCSPNNPARISGSTGEQGILDPANTNASDGLVWPGTAVVATLFLDTGQVLFTDANNALVGTGVLPGVSGFPAFPEGMLNFTNVRLPVGKSVTIAANASLRAAFTSSLGIPPPALVLSCQDVVLDAGSLLAVGTTVNGAPILQATGTPVVLPGAFPGGGASTALPAGGLGPRAGGGPAAGSLYPSLGGTGGASGSVAVTCGLGNVVCPSGGFGGGALLVAASQKITVNGTMQAQGTNGVSGGQGGGGGSVRLAAVLVEGIGTINTAGGTGGPAGPIEIQTFVQDLFAGTTTTTPIRGNPVATPLPSNLPEIDVVEVSVGGQPFCFFECSNTGSLETPDVELPPASTVQTVEVEAETTRVPLGTNLVFRAVGMDGSVSEATASVVASTPCSGIEGACVNLNLNPGTAYQIVVTPTTAFAMARVEERFPFHVAGEGSVQVASLGGRSQGGAAPAQPVPIPPRRDEGSEVRGAVRERASAAGGSDQLAKKWARAFGVELSVTVRLARVRTVASDER